MGHKIPEISKEEQSPLVLLLLEIIEKQQEEIQVLKDEIARLKNNPTRPKMKPSQIGKEEQKERRREGRSMRRKRKTKDIVIHETVTLEPKELPEGSKFLWYREYVVQELVIEPYNIRYQRGIWKTADGRIVRGKLPEGLEGHYGEKLRSYILYEYYGMHVSRPLILEHLLEMGFKISSGEIDWILTKRKDEFHKEKEGILEEGLSSSSYVVVDDTGARHQGKNGYCTHIGNELFAYFESSESKSRVNFLKVLRGRYTDYVIDKYALCYIQEHGFSKDRFVLLERSLGKVFEDEKEWQSYLRRLGILEDRQVKGVTEGALLGSLISHGVSSELVVLSDDARQFDVFLHALCWVHAERKIDQIVPINDEEHRLIQEIQDKIWKLYADLKQYKQSPNLDQKIGLENRFDEIFMRETPFESLNKALFAIHQNKKELLLVLKRPEIPLHNNISENDIREVVTTQNISHSTRSDLGRKCRDTFLSLKKTCRKLNISFSAYLFDRISRRNSIPFLPILIHHYATGVP